MLNKLFFILMILIIPIFCSIDYKYEDINLNGKWDPFENLIKSNPNDKYITIGGTITEIVFSLGYGNSVIAVDQSSTMPSRVKFSKQILIYSMMIKKILNLLVI